MTYPTFLSLINGLNIDTDPCLPFNLDGLFRYAYQQDAAADKAILVQYWETGGVSGGSCWDSSNPQPYSTGKSVPSTFAALDKVLLTAASSMSFLHYRTLAAAVVEDGTETYYEYYGNYTGYAYQLVKVRALYDKLVEMKLIESTS